MIGFEHPITHKNISCTEDEYENLWRKKFPQLQTLSDLKNGQNNIINSIKEWRIKKDPRFKKWYDSSLKQGMSPDQIEEFLKGTL